MPALSRCMRQADIQHFFVMVQPKPMGRSFNTKGGAFQCVKSSASSPPNLLQPRPITPQNVSSPFRHILLIRSFYQD